MRFFARLSVVSIVLSSFALVGIGGLVTQAAATPPTGVTYYVNATQDFATAYPLASPQVYATDCASSTNTDCGIDDAIEAFDHDTITGSTDTILFASGSNIFQVTNPTSIFNNDGVILSIDGNGPDATTVTGDDVNTVFDVSEANDSISGLTITGGNNSGGVYVGPMGGVGTTLHDDTISNNPGGAVYLNYDSALSMTDDTVSDNVAAYGGSGGGVFVSGDAYTVSITNDTFFDNPAASDGGLDNAGTNTTMTNDTFFDSEIINRGTIAIENSILDSPTSCSVSGAGSISDGGYNVESDDSCGLGVTSIVGNTTIGLAASLAANGSSGPQTLAIGPSSSAFNEVPVADCTVGTDERGVSRPGIAGENCDAGAYEFASASALQIVGVQVARQNIYVATLNVPSGTPAPSESVVISDSAGNSCSAPLTVSAATSYSGGCEIGGEVAGETVTATYNASHGDPNYVAITSNTVNAQTESGQVGEPAPPSLTTQVIAFPALDGRRWGSAPFSITALASSGLNLSFASTTPEVCGISGATVSILDTGICTLVATQDGNTQYQAATPVTRSFSVIPIAPGSPSIRVTSRAKGSLQISLASPVDTGGRSITTYQYSLDGRGWTKIAMTSGSFVIAKLSSKTTYSVRLRAINDVGAGSPSLATRVKVD
jgi:hypothetical protein